MKMDVNNKAEHPINEKMKSAEDENNANNVHNECNHKEEQHGFKALYKDPKTRLIAITAGSLFLFLVIVIVIVVLLSDDGEWMHDVYPRYLRMIPKPNAPRNTIRFRHGRNSEGRGWPALSDELKYFLKAYDSRLTLTGLKNITSCGKEGPPEGQVCYWDSDEIQALCKPSQNFGYPEGDPCVFLQLNKIMNFQVEPYTHEDLHILTSDSLTNYRIGQSYLFIECKGNTVVDIENAGKIRYAPYTQEFPRQFFPYTGHPDYMSPFIAIKFENPRKNLVIGITCRLWAKNFTHSQGFSPSELPFNLFIE